MKQFFKELWWYLRFIWYLFTTPATITNPEPEEPAESTEPDVYEYTEELEDLWSDNEDTSSHREEEIHEINENEENMENNEMKKVVICLDNGHGDNTPGKCSPWSARKVPPELPFREYAYCREIVSRLAKVLNEDGYPVYIVTPENTDIELKERGKRINGVVAEAKTNGMHVISISIHNNAAGRGDAWKEAYGWSVWTTRGQNNSDKLAQCLFDTAKEVLTPLGQKTRHDVSDGDDDYEDNFAMCRMPNCPAVLTENMFQDCIKEVEFLLTEEGKNAIVEIHRRGILKFIELMNW